MKKFTYFAVIVGLLLFETGSVFGASNLDEGIK